jgi:hypothetical protein
MTFKKLAISDAPRLVFGTSPRPMQCGLEISIGSGQVLPEVNSTLPAIGSSEESWGKVAAHYEDPAKNNSNLQPPRRRPAPRLPVNQLRRHR